MATPSHLTINPIELEHRFRSLIHSLSYPSSARQRILRISTFLDDLGNDYSAGEPYILELAERLPRVISEADFVGSDPRQILSMYRKLESYRDRIPAIGSIRGLGEALDRLKLAAAELLAYAGEIRDVLEVLDGSFAPGLPDWIVELEQNPQLPPFARLQKVLIDSKARQPTSTNVLGAIAERWIQKTAARFDTTLVPVVEQPLTQQATATDSSTLRRLTLKVLGPSTDGKDDVHSDAAVFGAESNAENLVATPLLAARNLIAETHSQLAKTFITGQLAFGDEHALHKGSSGNLAIAALTYCAILRFANERNQYNILQSVCITGDVSPTGEVLPVDAKQMSLKVDAAFFSWVECLVVPKQHIAEAEAEVVKLKEQYPRRALAIVAVGHLRELFFDRRITELTRVSLPRHTVRKMWKWRRPIVGVFLLALLAVIFRLAYGPLDKNPVIYEFKGEMLLLKNKNNQVVDEIRVGERTVNGYIAGEGLVRSVAFADVDGDGRNEIFWLQYPLTGSSSYTIVSCKSVAQEEPLWSVTTTRSISFPKSTDVSNPEFSAKQIVVDDLDGDGRYEVLVTAVHNAFPCLLLKLDALTGKELACYLHIGHLTDMKIWDLNGDGVKEVILCGINNAYKNACLFVLDPRDMSGHSLTTEDYLPTGFQPAHEKAYVRIPRTIIGSLYERIVKYNAARSINIEENKHIIRAYVQEVYGIQGKPNERISAGLYLNFGFDLSPIDVTSGDDFDALYDYHVKEKQIPAINRNDYLRQYKNTMLYWDGEKWGNAAEGVLRR